MEVVFTKSAWADYCYWEKVDKKKLNKINQLLKIIQKTPFEVDGKPEPLKFQLQGFWSRRIDKKNRLVYSYSNRKITVISCRHHY